MPVRALHQVRPMRGHTKPQLMLCEDDASYIVKFHTEACTIRHLVTEYVVTEIAREIGLSVPECAFVEVSEFLIENTPDLGPRSSSGVRYSPGLHFGSRLVEGSPTDLLPRQWIDNSINRSEFAGMLALDHWCANAARRKAIFHRNDSGSRYSAVFISHEMSFEGARWSFDLSTIAQPFYCHSVYRDVESWDSFEPYLSRLTSFTPESALRIVRCLPPDWCVVLQHDIDQLIDVLLRRRARVHGLLAESMRSSPEIFPQWQRSIQVYQGSTSLPSPRWIGGYPAPRNC